MKRKHLIASSLIISALLSGCNSNAASSKSSIPSSEIISSIDELAEESIGEADTIFDETKNEVLITKTASKGSALKIKRTKSDYGPVWEDKTDAFKSVSKSAYDFVQAEDYSVSCRIKVFSDEDADFALFEAVNGKVVYNAINDSSFASDAVTEKQAYSMSILQVIISCTSEENLRNGAISSRWMIAKALCPSAVDESTADIKPGAYTQVYNKAKEFNDSISNISDTKDEVDALIKEMRNKYSEHSDEINLLHEYYVESTLMAELALSPSGSLLTYRSDFDEMKTNISRAEKYADIY